MVYIVSINGQNVIKNPEIPSCTDLILTNMAKSFQSTCVIEPGLSECH